MNIPVPNQYCEFLSWDSHFWGYYIARTTVPEWREEIVVDIMKWQKSEHIRCLYTLVDVADFSACKFVPHMGGNCVDVRVSFERNLVERIEDAPLPVDLVIRPVVNSDVPTLINIASYSYYDTRFYFDQYFDRSKSNTLYQLWIENSCQKILADEVWVAEMDDCPVGYITCVVKQHVGTIGLVGVSRDVRGHGIGKQLVLCALRWFKQQGCTIVKVATQGRNVLAQRVYQRTHFLTSNIGLWYHTWR